MFYFETFDVNPWPVSKMESPLTRDHCKKNMSSSKSSNHHFSEAMLVLGGVYKLIIALSGPDFYHIMTLYLGRAHSHTNKTC